MNPFAPLIYFLGKGMFRYAMLIAAISIISWYLSVEGIDWAAYILWISLILLATIIIWRAGDFFSSAATYIQEKHEIPQSIKAAVIDAIASSFPEFCVAVIAVLMIGRAEVGISSIIGSALYNVLVIPAAAGLVATSPMVISKEVVWRDNIFYFGVVLLLGAMLWQFPNEWSVGVALLFLLAYIGYVVLLHRDFKKSRNQGRDNFITEEVEDDDEDLLELQSEKKAWLWIMLMMFVMGGASHMLVESSLSLGDMLGIDGVIMGFVVIAAGTSVPDTALSVISAKKGHYDAAVSNVFGSNIFDICVCLSIPILLALAMSGEPTYIDLPQTGLIWSLIGATLLSIYFFWSNNYTLTKFKAGMMGILYLLIILISFTF
ncbi:sodium:calcium antiporter [bacterium]|nr:sodium:calcium antiporter [bacterium]